MEGCRIAGATGLRSRERHVVMHGGMGAMMASMGLIWILVVVVVVLAIVALFKYVVKN